MVQDQQEKGQKVVDKWGNAQEHNQNLNLRMEQAKEKETGQNGRTKPLI